MHSIIRLLRSGCTHPISAQSSRFHASPGAGKSFRLSLITAAFVRDPKLGEAHLNFFLGAPLKRVFHLTFLDRVMQVIWRRHSSLEPQWQDSSPAKLDPLPAPVSFRRAFPPWRPEQRVTYPASEIHKNYEKYLRSCLVFYENESIEKSSSSRPVASDRRSPISGSLRPETNIREP